MRVVCPRTLSEAVNFIVMIDSDSFEFKIGNLIELFGLNICFR